MSGMFRAVERTIGGFSRRRSPTILRVAIGLMFIWFGVLKLLGQSPVEGMVMNAVPWAPEDYVVLVLGSIEVIVGIGLLAALWLPLVMGLLWLQAVVFGLSLILESQLGFQPGNPLVPTVQGDFLLRLT